MPTCTFKAYSRQAILAWFSIVIFQLLSLCLVGGLSPARAETDLKTMLAHKSRDAEALSSALLDSFSDEPFSLSQDQIKQLKEVRGLLDLLSPQIVSSLRTRLKNRPIEDSRALLMLAREFSVADSEDRIKIERMMEYAERAQRLAREDNEDELLKLRNETLPPDEREIIETIIHNYLASTASTISTSGQHFEAMRKLSLVEHSRMTPDLAELFFVSSDLAIKKLPSIDTETLAKSLLFIGGDAFLKLTRKAENDRPDLRPKYLDLFTWATYYFVKHIRVPEAERTFLGIIQRRPDPSPENNELRQNLLLTMKSEELRDFASVRFEELRAFGGLNWTFRLRLLWQGWFYENWEYKVSTVTLVFLLLAAAIAWGLILSFKIFPYAWGLNRKVRQTVDDLTAKRIKEAFVASVREKAKTSPKSDTGQEQPSQPGPEDSDYVGFGTTKEKDTKEKTTATEDVEVESLLEDEPSAQDDFDDDEPMSTAEKASFAIRGFLDGFKKKADKSQEDPNNLASRLANLRKRMNTTVLTETEGQRERRTGWGTGAHREQLSYTVTPSKKIKKIQRSKFRRARSKQDEYGRLLSIIGLDESAGEEEINKRYRDFLKIYHPDIRSTILNEPGRDLDAEFRDLKKIFDRLRQIRSQMFKGKRG